MDKIAFIADIHSNITALKEVIKDIKERGISKIICVGDMIGKGPSPDEVIDILKKECFDIVIGNLETSITQVETKIHGIWNRDKLGKDRIAYINSLNYMGSIVFAGKKIVYFHTLSKDNYLTEVKRIYKDDEISIKKELFKVDYEADIIIYADIHKQYMQNIENKVIINTGSVGNKLTTENEEVLAEYVVLEENLNRGIDVKFIKVTYDKEKEKEITLKSDMPHKEKYIEEMFTGIYIKIE